jgi:hypothetical protein
LKRGTEIAERLIDYTRVLSTVKHLAPLANLLVPGSGMLLEAVGTAAGEAADKTKESAGQLLDRWKNAPEKLSLSAARKRIVDLLDGADRCIVVVVDDLDRLPPADLGAMVQAVKAVADFPNVIYLLAYDPQTASTALRSAFRLRAGEGRRYLEKIIQLQIPVPEAPAFKIQAFATDRFTAVLSPLVGNEVDQKDVEEALPLAAALMQTPRDVARLRTRLLVTARDLTGNVNLADVLLAEAVSLKTPGIIDYVDRNRSALLTARIEQYDTAHRHRGDLGDPFDDIGLRDEEKESRARAVRDGWKPLASPGTRIHAPLVKAMAFLFDATCNSQWGAPEVHASHLRVQRLRNWVRWRAVVGHAESYENSEVAAWIADPESLKASRAWSDAGSFLDACALISDFADEAREADCQRFAAVFVEAANRFGEDALLTFNLHFGPHAALETAIRKDSQDHRIEALRRILGEASVWLSYPIVAMAYRDLFGADQRPPKPVSEQLIQVEGVIREFADTWVKSAMNVLPALSEPNPSRSGFDLAARISHLKVDAARLESIVSEIITMRADGLEIMFCGREFDDSHLEQWGVPRSSFLPDARVLLTAAEKSPEFLENRKGLVAFWRRQANQGDQATLPAAQ